MVSMHNSYRSFLSNQLNKTASLSNFTWFNQDQATFVLRTVREKGQISIHCVKQHSITSWSQFTVTFHIQKPKHLNKFPKIIKNLWEDWNIFQKQEANDQCIYRPIS